MSSTPVRGRRSATTADVDFQLAGYLVVRITGRQLRFHPEKALVLVAVAFAQRRLAA